MLTRRTLLSALGATAGTALAAPAWADAGDPAYLAAAREPSGTYALFGLTGAGDLAFRVPLPDRGHAAAGHPTRAEAVAFARRPGTFALVLGCATGRVLHRLYAPAGRHFYGHGAYLDGGRVLATTENAYDTGEGRLGLWDVAAGYARMGEIASGGIGPHEVVRLPGTDVLAVANGGIRTHPATDREKLNLDTMRPNLSYIVDGRVAETVELPHRQASIRHIAARSDGMVAMALQWEGPQDVVVPLAATHRRGGPARLLTPGDATLAEFAGYGGSVAISGDGTRIGITGPRGGLAQVFDAKGGTLHETVRRTDVCGVAPCRTGLLFTDGGGGILGDGVARRHPLAWDNHLVAI